MNTDLQKILLIHLSLLFGFFSNANIINDLMLMQDLNNQAMEKAVYRADSLFSMSQISQDSLVSVYYHTAKAYRENHDFQSAREHLNKALSKFNDIESGPVAEIYLLLAEMAMEEDDNPEALGLLSKGLEIYENAHDSTNYLFTLKKIGINYDYLNDHEAARGYYEECIALAVKLDLPEVIGACYNNIGGMFSQDGNHEEALKYFEKGVPIALDIENMELLHKLYHNTSLTYEELELFTEAKSYLGKSLDIAKKVQDAKLLCFSYQGLGFYYLGIGKLDSSEYFMNLTLSIATKINNSQLKGNAREALEEIYYSTGRYKEAYDLSKILVAENDSLFTLENSRLVESIKRKYQAEKRERELAETNLQLQQAGYDLNRQRVWQIALVILVVFLMVIAFLIYRAYSLRIKANELLLKRNAEVEAHVTHVENLNKTKSRWFINVAHELRTPLTLIKGPVNRVINQLGVSEEAKEDLILVERNANKLSNLVNEILDLSKMESGKIHLKESTFRLSDLAQQIIESFEERTKQLRISLTYQFDHNIFIKADENKIHKVVVNLVSNAIKFTPRGGTIDLIVKKDTDWVKVIVKDNGSGISAQDLPFVFDRFFQSSDPEDQAIGGTGIGLSLSKEIADLHGGVIGVQSIKNHGSTFTLGLPLSRIVKMNESVDLGETVETSPLNGGKKPYLLLVEDNSDMRQYVSSLLNEYFEVVEAQEGGEALQKLVAYDISFIISDVMMEGMDGISFLKKVKEESVWNHLPFIHLSATEDVTVRKEANRIGIDDFLEKPFDPDELIFRVKNLYDNYLNRSALEAGDRFDQDDDVKLEKLRDSVLTHIDDRHFNVVRMANDVAMSERHLYRYLKSATGLTPLQYIEEIKLTKALELAQNKTYTNANDLAAAVGFKQSTHFSSLFEKRFGKKPTYYLHS